MGIKQSTFLKFFFIYLIFPFCIFGKTQNIKIEGYNLKVEIADNQIKRQKGLMFRKQLGKNEGMLFIFHRPDILIFWMKNTFIPLSIAFFGKDKRLINIEKMPPNQTKKTYRSKKKALYALEVNQNWFEKRKITTGSLLVFVK